MSQQPTLDKVVIQGQGSNPPEKEPRESWDPQKIKWLSAQGSKGQYERSEDVDNPEFEKMLQDLGTHKGKLYRNGLFYWLFTNGRVVGRKRRGKS